VLIVTLVIAVLVLAAAKWTIDAARACRRGIAHG
jgi:Tfp pilus assembly protein PilX